MRICGLSGLGNWHPQSREQPAYAYLRRGVSIAISFGQVFPQTKQATVITLRCYSYGCAIIDLQKTLHRRDLQAAGIGMVKTAFVTAALVGAYLGHPLFKVAVILESLVADIMSLGTAVIIGDPIRLVEAIVKFLQSAIKATLKLYYLPELLLAAAIFAVLTALAKSLHQVQRFQWPEAFAQIAIAFILAQEIDNLLIVKE